MFNKNDIRKKLKLKKVVELKNYAKKRKISIPSNSKKEDILNILINYKYEKYLKITNEPRYKKLIKMTKSELIIFSEKHDVKILENYTKHQIAKKSYNKVSEKNISKINEAIIENPIFDIKEKEIVPIDSIKNKNSKEEIDADNVNFSLEKKKSLPWWMPIIIGLILLLIVVGGSFLAGVLIK
ncbi:MAG: hypothetical protein K4H23_02150 [Mollicutes bacterium PWAP]|nr:hypothetical protein [Mollicutes bacterium PWAP]